MSGPVDQGQTFRYRHFVKDSSGALANAGTVTVTVTKPDLTTTAATVVNSFTGVYDISYTTVQVGLHNLNGVATGGVLGTETDEWEDVFVVEQPLRMFISVDEASAHLHAQGVITTDVDREQLRWHCMLASDVVEGDLGLVIAPRTVTETFDGCGYGLSLGYKPPRYQDGGSITIVSVSEDGSALTVGDYSLRKRGWMLFKGGSVFHTPWAPGYDNISVTYRTGCPVPPRVVRHVALNVLQTMWQASQQSEHPFLDEVARRASLATLSTSVFGSLSRVEQAAYQALKSVNSA